MERGAGMCKLPTSRRMRGAPSLSSTPAPFPCKRATRFALPTVHAATLPNGIQSADVMTDMTGGKGLIDKQVQQWA